MPKTVPKDITDAQLLIARFEAAELDRHRKTMDRIRDAQKLFDELAQKPSHEILLPTATSPLTPRKRTRIVNLGGSAHKIRIKPDAIIRDEICSSTEIYQLRNIRSRAEKRHPGVRFQKKAFRKVNDDLIEEGIVKKERDGPARSGGNYYQVIKPK